MKRLVRYAWLLSVCSFLAPTGGSAQETPSEQAGSLRMFLDCTGFLFCDLDFYRREINFVSYVRDRQDADVHVLITTQQTGGGFEYRLNFIGLGDFSGIETTLTHNSSSTDTEDERRNGLARVVKFGLMRYVAESPVADQIDIRFRAAGPQEAGGPIDDPWNYWVFEIGTNGSINGEQSNRRYNIGGSISANRVTEEWKLNLRLNGNYSRSDFELNDSTTFINTSKSYGGNGLLVRSLTNRWSAGARTSVTASTFLNTDLRFRFAPALEYNIFPYEESSRRQFTLRYAFGINAVDYEQETIFDKNSETLLEHTLTGSLSFTQPWGSSSVSLEGAQFLSDLAKNQVTLGGSISLRIVRGLQFSMFGDVSRVRDQLHLAKGGATDEEILLRRRQLGTSYRYFVLGRFSYRFGSIFNNVVNPRFEQSGGGFFFF